MQFPFNVFSTEYQRACRNVIFGCFQIVALTCAMTPNPQPCMICGGAVARFWSLQSHVGDHYLRIIPNSNITGGKGVDFGGIVDVTNTSVDGKESLWCSIK